ncbi:MAG: hypothetical protein EXS31_04050 [Pedosphaera sp.]|nr:hypothetical protein [Pedosphaera sp.]
MKNKLQTTAGNGQTTIAPLAPAANGANLPIEFLRLPKPGTQCPVTGLSRSYLNSLILPSDGNGHRPPVKSVCLRQRGAKKGVRLVSWDSLKAHLYANLDGIEQGASK